MQVKSVAIMEPIVTVCPSDDLDFVVGGGPAVVHVRNVSIQNVIYKVKTTAPDCYLVKPYQGLLQPGQEAEVSISFKNSHLSNPTQAKFQIQAASWSSEHVRDIGTALAEAPIRLQRVLEGRVLSEPIEVPSESPAGGVIVQLKLRKTQLESEKASLELELRNLQASESVLESEKYSILYLALVFVLGGLVGSYFPFILP